MAPRIKFNENCEPENCPHYKGCRKCEPQQGYRWTQHHLYWPKAEYTSKIELIFRNLPENIIHLCRFQHDLLHRSQSPPKKPAESIMEKTIQEAAEQRVLQRQQQRQRMAAH